MGMNIGIDLDTTLIKLPHMEIASKEFGVNFNETDVQDWAFQKGFTELFRKRIFELFSDPVIMCEKIVPIDGTQNKIREWFNRGFNLNVITSRADILQFKTVEMISILYPEISSVHFCPINKDKNEILIDKKIDIFIDDGPHNIESALKLKNINCIMISNKYTRYNWHLRGIVNWKKSISEINL
jgi:5'(3')-deoxyribonucleotidase